jgi:ABC-2 type transport system permease protein/oleandomycin transport system permease protein
MPDEIRLAGAPVAALGAFALEFGSAFAWIAATVGLTVRNPETAQSAGFVWMFSLTFASAALAPRLRCPAGCSRSSRPTRSPSSPTQCAPSPPMGQRSARCSRAWPGSIGLTVVFAPLAIRQYRRLA